VAPAPEERFLVRLTIDKATHDKLRHAQALLSHAVPSGDVAEVFGRALDTLIVQLERRKTGATTRPQRLRPRSGRNQRHIPAHVRRAVWERDGGQCTFVSEAGHRCKARRLLEYDHVDPVARGGEATVGRMRLRCRAHNQYEAERVFGAAFMRRKRGEGRTMVAETRPGRARWLPGSGVP
jgi:5-methylcytosine-specific restriction endonuclease McrA